MAFEVDYMPVGDGEKSGDAIALRYGNFNVNQNDQTVIIIDGGYKKSGEDLVNHVRNHYKTNRADIVICTHPDVDHASGLSVVMEELDIGQLAMHKPWDYASDIKHLFKDGRITTSGLEKKLESSLQHAKDLEELANRKNIPIIEPFQGEGDSEGIIHVLGPSKNYYQELLAGLPCTPQAKDGILDSIKTGVKKVTRWIDDHFDIDIMDNDDDTTSAANNTSAIILFKIDGHKLLFTGDAGKTALHAAADYAYEVGEDLTNLFLFDVPHHGSKRNLNSKILKRINGSTAIISACKDSDKHPSKKLTNALQKHGANVYVTRGTGIRHGHNCGTRDGWKSAKSEPFHYRVEE